jgi:hypothetical protein
VLQIDDIEKQVVRPREKQRTPEKRLQILKQWLEEKGIQVGRQDSLCGFLADHGHCSASSQ